MVWNLGQLHPTEVNPTDVNSSVEGSVVDSGKDSSVEDAVEIPEWILLQLYIYIYVCIETLLRQMHMFELQTYAFHDGWSTRLTRRCFIT